MSISGVSLTGDDAGNYTLTVPASAMADIFKKTIGIGIGDAVKPQKRPDPVLSYPIIGGALADGDQTSGVPIRDPGKATGNYMIRPGSLTVSPNYEIHFPNGVFSIVPGSFVLAKPSQSSLLGQTEN